MLRALGLDDTHIRLYDELLDVVTATETELAASLGLPLLRVRVGLADLQSLGLVSRSCQHPDRVRAAPPDVGLGSLLAARRAALDKVERRIDDLTSRYRAIVEGREDADVVDVVRGTDAVGRRMSQLVRGARSEVLTLVPADAGASVSGFLRGESGGGAVEHGVAQRMVVARTWLDRPGLLDQVKASRRRGEALRVVDTVPLRLAVADGKLGVVPMPTPDDDGRQGALLLRPGALLDGLIALFDLLWRQGHPLAEDAGERGAHGSPLDELDQQVLALLMSGLTDQSIGRQLGLSLRTVQRRARGLMDAVGVTTRLQLGYEIARRGWM